MKNYFNHKMRGKSPALMGGLIFLAIIGITGLAILFGFIIMWLWNWLMPEIFGLPSLTYWQAIGLFILSKILLGGFGGGGGSKNKKHSNSCHSNDKRGKKSDFSKWEHYDKFWQEKGESQYTEYVEGLNKTPEINADSDSTSADESNIKETE